MKNEKQDKLTTGARCPFCDGKAERVFAFEPQSYRIQCESCGARTATFPHLRDALAAWSRRRKAT